MDGACSHVSRWRAWDRSEIYCPDCGRVFTDSELEDVERAKIPTAKPPIGTYSPGGKHGA